MNAETRKAFLTALGEYVKERGGTDMRTYNRVTADDLVEVVSFEEETHYGGYCETCAYEEQVIVVTYKTASGELKRITIWDSFANLLNALLRG